jgi:hypothetical protein
MTMVLIPSAVFSPAIRLFIIAEAFRKGAVAFSPPRREGQ